MQDKRLMNGREYSGMDTHEIELYVAAIPDQVREDTLVWADRVITSALADDGLYFNNLPSDLRPSSFIKDDRLPESMKFLDQALVNGEIKEHQEALGFLCHALGIMAADDHNRMIAAWQRLPHSQAAWRGYESALESLYRTSSSKIKNVFRDLAGAYVEKPDIIGVPSQERDSFNKVVDEWRRDGSVRSVWDERSFSYFPIHYVGAGLFRLAVNFTMTFGLGLLDKAQLPPLCEFVFSSPDILNDKDALIKILEKSGTTLLNGETSAWNHNTVAPMALDMILLHVDRLHESIRRSETGNALVSFQEKEAPSIFKHASKTLLSRPDGSFLGCHYLCHLAHRIPDMTKGRWSSVQTFYEVLAKEAGQTPIGWAQFSEHRGWEWTTPDSYRETRLLGVKLVKENLPTVYEFAAALTVIYQNEECEPDHPELLEYFRQMLFYEGNKIYNIEYGGNGPLQWYHYKLALPYINDENPLDRWHKTWEDLSSVRHQMKHHPYQCDEVPKEAVKCLALTGIALFDWLNSGEFRSKIQPLSVLEAVWRAVYGLWLQFEYSRNDFWESLISNALLRFGIYFEQRGAGEIEMLCPYLESLGGANRLIALTACNLKLNIKPNLFLKLRPIIEPAVEAFQKKDADMAEKQLQYPALAEACGKLFD